MKNERKVQKNANENKVAIVTNIQNNAKVSRCYQLFSLGRPFPRLLFPAQPSPLSKLPDLSNRNLRIETQ